MSARVVFRYALPSKDRPDRRLLVRRTGAFSSSQFQIYKEATAGTRFDPKTKEHVATVDKLPGILKRLRDAGLDTLVTPEVAEALDKHEITAWLDLQAAKERLEILNREMAKKGQALYPYQILGVEWLATRHRGLLADDMGMGKGIQALCALPSNAPVLVICPASIKGVWISEAGKWRPTLSPQALEGRGSFRYPKPGEMVITNFDILPRCHLPKCTKKTIVICDGCSPLLPEAHVASCKRGTIYCPGCAPMPGGIAEGTVMIVDEVHACKSRTSLRSESVRSIAGRVRADGGRTWYATGTPILNTPDELWNILESCDLAHEAFGSWNGFVRCYAGEMQSVEIYDKKKRAKVKRSTGLAWGAPLDEAADKLQRVMLRRLKKDYLHELPAKSKRLLPIDVSKATIKELDQHLRKLGGLEAITKILSQKTIPFEMVSIVRSALARAKIPAMLEQIEHYEDNQEPLLVFSAHRAPIDLLTDREGWATITGSTPARDRTEIVSAFQAGKFKGLGGTIAAMGTGVTLTYASRVLFVDQEWTPTANEQAEDRVLRIGQKNAVFIEVLVANHPLDQRVGEILNAKTELITGIVDAAREAG